MNYLPLGSWIHTTGFMLLTALLTNFFNDPYALYN
jgi:hypothetical protein